MARLHWRANVSIIEIPPQRGKVSIFKQKEFRDFTPPVVVPINNVTLTLLTEEFGDVALFHIEDVNYYLTWMSALAHRPWKLRDRWWPGMIVNEPFIPPSSNPPLPTIIHESWAFRPFRHIPDYGNFHLTVRTTPST